MTERLTEFSGLYRKYSPDVFRFAYYLSGNRMEAEDITSETFVRAWTSTTPLIAASIKAYLFTIARNLYLQSRRHAGRHEPLHDVITDNAPTPDADLEHRDELDAVVIQISKLPESDRAAFLMRVDGISYEEIASSLGMSAGAARVKVHRARVALSRIR